MLTKELAIFELDRDRLVPERLTRQRHGHYVGYAREMLRLYEEGIGRTRRELHARVKAVFRGEPDCPPRRIEAFCKLLDEEKVAEYETDPRGAAAVLRLKVFTLAGPMHPLVEERDRLFEHSETEAKENIARQLGRSKWAEIEPELFADVFECNRLKRFSGYAGPEALLSRYNVAQAQAALFLATRLFIEARADFQRIVTQAKLARLLHDIRPGPGEGYTIILDGPASVLRETRRYGADMAKFLPALLSCRDWRLRAEIRLRSYGAPLRLELSSESGLKGRMAAPPEFDSSVEEAFARKWGTEARDGWSLRRAGRILQRGQTVFVPDFVLNHLDGREVLLEIVGFWTPEYLQAKIEKLKLFEDQGILLAAAEKVASKWKDRPAGLILYKSALKLDAVLEALGAPTPGAAGQPQPRA
jgi:predicted nuclease of restriction endonuclease-like RecB superfamily